MLVPIQCGNSNHDDIVAIENSLIQSLGSAVTDTQLSNVEIWACALSRAIYWIWAINANAGNQFDPETVDTTLTRWETIFNLQPAPTADLQSRRDALTEKFSLLNEIPSTTNVKSLLTAVIPQVFRLLLTTAAIHAYAGPGPNNVGPTINASVWYSTAANIYVDLHKPGNMSQYTFWQQAYQVFPTLNQFLPAWTEFDWFTSTFSAGGTMSVAEGGNMVTGSGTQWATPTNATRGTYAIQAGSIIEALDDKGNFFRMQVASVTNNTLLVLNGNAPSTFTNQPYFIQGFFVDCNPSDFPFPPVSFNCDNAAVDCPPINYL